MGDTPVVPQTIVSASEPRRWIAAIVGGVVLGEALWAMLQLLIRDWATPALLNATGQGPTQNPAAFEPLPLVIAFVETCAAAIVLVLLMAWAQKKTRMVVRTVAAPMASAAAARPTVVPPSVAVPPAPAVAPRPVAAVPVPPVAAQPVAAPVPVASAPVAPAQTATIAAPVAAPVAPQPTAPKAATPPAPKKPKTIYYNSVGEPIEE
jgi:hypothetical protein